MIRSVLLSFPVTSVVRFRVGIFAVGFQGSFYFAICIWGAQMLPILLESAIFVRLHRLVVIGRFLTGSPLPCSLAPVYGGGWEGDHQRQRSSVKLACHHQTASDTSQEHEMCSSVPIRFPCTCIGRFRHLAPALPDQDSAPI